MIDAHTKLYCIIGNPVEHSLSPQMYNAAFSKIGLPFVFLAFKISDLKKAFEGLRELGTMGIVITVPHKIKALEFVDEVDENSSKIGATNAIINKNGKFVAANTDWIGALDALHEKNIKIQGSKVALFGAGGAARAISYALRRENASVCILNRSLERGKRLVREFQLTAAYLPSAKEVVSSCDIIINTTTVGMYPKIDVSIVNKEWISESHTVFDIVYTPHETKLLRDAKEMKAKVIYGYKMVLYGGIRIFELFTNKKAPVEVMEKALINALANNNQQLTINN